MLFRSLDAQNLDHYLVESRTTIIKNLGRCFVPPNKKILRQLTVTFKFPKTDLSQDCDADTFPMVNLPVYKEKFDGSPAYQSSEARYSRLAVKNFE